MYEKEIQYELVSSVVNDKKGKDGMHPAVLVRQNTKYYIYDDKIKREINMWNPLEGHPQLLFYVQSEK